MKRIISLILAVIILSASALALAAEASPFDFTAEELPDGSTRFTFRDLSLRIPAEWKGKFTAKKDDSGISFYQTSSYEKYLKEKIPNGGYLFRLAADVPDYVPETILLGKSGSSGLTYSMMMPTDYPAYNQPAIRAEYNDMIAQTAGIADTVEFVPAAPAKAPAQSSAGWTTEQVRYAFEHSMLPRYFYDDPGNMMGYLGENGLFRLWEAVATDNGADPAAQESDFVLHWYRGGDGTDLVQAELPKPTETPLCYRIYFLFNAQTGAAGYYTVEYDNFLGETAFLCGWTAGMEHRNYGGARILNPEDPGYASELLEEAREVAQLAGVSGGLEAAGDGSADPYAGLQVIECPQLGFTVGAEPAYGWDYTKGTGITIYTKNKGYIPYVIVYRAEDLIMEPFEFIQEQFTPHMKKQYGSGLVRVEEAEAYEIGGKKVAAGLYTYLVQGTPVDMIRIYDSTGDRTVTYTAKYIQGEGEATLAALDTAIRTFHTEG